MTDRELLEKAAKAAGIDAEVHEELGLGPEGLWLKGARTPDGHKYWNPLADDGDALRLAVRLHLSPEVHFDASQPLPWLRVVTRRRGQGESWEYVAPEVYAADPCAATRRAIVRAAAAIGEAMP